MCCICTFSLNQENGLKRESTKREMSMVSKRRVAHIARRKFEKKSKYRKLESKNGIVKMDVLQQQKRSRTTNPSLLAQLRKKSLSILYALAAKVAVHCVHPAAKVDVHCVHPTASPDYYQ
jgi:hypothetical protein